MSHSFRYQNSLFNYYQYGCGSRPLLAFHGFGQNGQMFAPVQKLFEHEFTIYSFDFAWHGKTHWQETAPCTKPEIISMIKLFMHENGFEKISLMGFSMGGRIVLSLIADLAHLLDEVYLFAPDGISERVYYRDVLANKVGEAAFRKILKYPNILINATHAFSKIGLTKKYVADYVKTYMNDSRRRQKLLDIWLSMRTFRTQLSSVKSSVEKHQLKIYLFWGKRDKILPVEYAHRFKKAVPSVQLILVEGGHFIVNEKLEAVMSNINH